MKLRSTQFGVRGNTASPRQHAPRLVVSSPLSQRQRVSAGAVEDERGASTTRLAVEAPDAFRGETQHDATGGEERDDNQLLTVRDVAEFLQVPVSWVYKHAGPRCPNPLPCMKLGKYLRFRSTDIMAFLGRTRANSLRFALNSHDHRR
jgi:predicted DNA-binding transcriptional regulator AlpA